MKHVNLDSDLTLKLEKLERGRERERETEFRRISKSSYALGIGKTLKSAVTLGLEKIRGKGELRLILDSVMILRFGNTLGIGKINWPS